MRRALAIAVTLGLVAALAWTPATTAQTSQTTPPSTAAPAGADKQVEGKVKSLDATGKKLTLIDGTELMIPDTVKISRTELRPGANVKVSYQEQGDQKIVRTLEVHK